MITGKLRSQIDKLWEEFWTGGITNPLTVIEQITFLMFARMLDLREQKLERIQMRTGKDQDFLFNDDQQHLRWSKFKDLRSTQMLPLVRDEVFPHFRTVAMDGAVYAEYMKDAQLLIQKESLLVSAIGMVDALPLEDDDSKGDLYEYLLSKLTTAGINGQFRTPRHIIRFMVDMLEPKPTETVGDPACGTGGFLVGVAQYLWETYTSPDQVFVDPETGAKSYSGDKLEPYLDHVRRHMFHGFDFDTTMLRIAAMNLLLHGVDAPDIHYQDTLATGFTERFPKRARDAFDIILANPPFKGSLDEEDVHRSLTATVKTKKTELLFVALIIRMLKLGGRSAAVVPDGVLFGSSKAHQGLRQKLVDENQLEGVISLPSGVFKPYAGVSTAILVFTKGGRTDRVWFYEVEADGLSLDDKRNKVNANDLPDALDRWRERNAANVDHNDRTKKGFWVPVGEIREKKFDLSVSRYKEVVHEAQEYEPPMQILAKMKTLEAEILGDLNELEVMLKDAGVDRVEAAE
ncbi:type I restriction-modification system subunit M [Nisaea sediminum]|uniref:type I restriction-modification system subunit M n=1 Tax=Nisaea sediminum TaxID=2775867 RepID=UPI0018678980|nr:class I SAM-dependent DNA methyltransferase [Nisaea sediminum]